VVYVSIGHRVSLETAIRVVMDCSPRYRIPEPQRLADRLSKLPPA
jgi:deoxyribonuclease V